MLRVLQEQAFERVGGNETIRTDVRLIAATHRDLGAWSKEGKYRPDLYYRLGVFTIELPPLRQRGDDLPMLVHHYVRRCNRELGREVREVTAEAMERLCGYPWPGNIRELQSVLKQALLRSTGPVLIPAFLPELAPRRADEPATASGAGSRLEALIGQRLRDGGPDLYEEARRELDRFLLPLVLRSTGGNQFQAARNLGIARRTLRLRLRELGLSSRSPSRGMRTTLSPSSDPLGRFVPGCSGRCQRPGRIALLGAARPSPVERARALVSPGCAIRGRNPLR
jgi:two-component system nitrogen regulation response regulator GlnG